LDTQTLQTILIDIWKDLLGVADVGLDDHFLDLGGDSMLALRLKSRIQERFGVEMTAEMLFDCATVRELSAALSSIL
jgi:acyl carrier protein